MTTDEQYRDIAKKRHEKEGSLEIDDTACVSRGIDLDSEDGAYVAAWIWVPNPESGTGEDPDQEEVATDGKNAEG